MHSMLPRKGVSDNLKALGITDLILRGISLVLAMGQVLGAIWFLGHSALITIIPGLLLGMLALLPKRNVSKIGWFIVIGSLGTGFALYDYIVPLWQKSEEFDVKALYAIELILIIYFVIRSFGDKLLGKP